MSYDAAEEPTGEDINSIVMAQGAHVGSSMTTDELAVEMKKSRKFGKI